MTKDSYNSSFPIFMLFISFSCLIALTTTSSTMLNKWQEQTSFLVANLRGAGMQSYAINYDVSCRFIVTPFSK